MHDPRQVPSARSVIHHTELPEAKPGETLFREWNTYRREAGRLLSEGLEGCFLLIKETAIIGVFAREEEALHEGYRRFPRDAFLVHQIHETEPILRVRGYNLPCPSSPGPLAKPA